MGQDIGEWTAPLFCALAVNILIVGEQIECKVLDYIGNISLELYLLHFLWLKVLRDPQNIYISSDYKYLIAYLLITFLSASMFHFFIVEMRNHISKIRRDSVY